MSGLTRILKEISLKDIFIVTTPFQFLGALEAIYKFKLKNNILIVIDNKLENNAKQLTNLIEKYSDLFNNVVRFGFENKSKFLKNVFLIKKLKKEIYNSIFIGDFGSIQKVYISTLVSKNVYLLDDGAKTLLIYNNIKNKKNFFKKSFRQFRFNIFGLKTTTNKRIDIFTFFNLDNLKNSNITKHNFEYFKYVYRLKEKQIEKKVYILGQPIVENKRVRIKSYEEYLNKIMERYEDCQFYYLMHRREDMKQLESYILKKNIEIIKSTIPGEIFFANMKSNPIAIIGVNTTLLFSLKKIYDNLDVLAYKFKKENILKSEEWFDEACIYFEKNDIKII